MIHQDVYKDHKVFDIQIHHRQLYHHYKSSAAKQKSLKNMFKGGSIKETMRRLISNFFIYESVPPQKEDSHHFKNMIFGAQQAGLSNCSVTPRNIP